MIFVISLLFLVKKEKSRSYWNVAHLDVSWMMDTLVDMTMTTISRHAIKLPKPTRNRSKKRMHKKYIQSFVILLKARKAKITTWKNQRVLRKTWWQNHPNVRRRQKIKMNPTCQNQWMKNEPNSPTQMTVRPYLSLAINIWTSVFA